MELPETFVSREGLQRPMAKLKVALYDFKQGTLKWYIELCVGLKELGMQHTESDWGVFCTHIGSDILILASHVDNCTVTENLSELIWSFKVEVGLLYKITDLGPVNWLLRMKVTQNHIEQTITLSQETYTNAILTKYNFTNLKLSAIPMNPSMQLL